MEWTAKSGTGGKYYSGGWNSQGAAFMMNINTFTGGGGGGSGGEWCGTDVLSTTTPSCGIIGLDPCGNLVCMATTTADVTAISITLLNALTFIIAIASMALSIWIFRLLVR